MQYTYLRIGAGSNQVAVVVFDVVARLGRGATHGANVGRVLRLVQGLPGIGHAAKKLAVVLGQRSGRDGEIVGDEHLVFPLDHGGWDWE